MYLSIAGHSLGVLTVILSLTVMYLKAKTLNSGIISVVFFSCFKTFKCPGDVFRLCIPLTICNIEVQSFGRFYYDFFNSDFDLAQRFFCSVKTVECCQIFLLACRQLRKKAQHNIIEQF